MSDDPLLEGWENQQKGHVFWEIVDKEAVLQATRERSERQWEGNLYPSGLYWSMCMAEHVYESLPKGWQGKITSSSQRKMAFGSAFHAMVQEIASTSRKMIKATYAVDDSPASVKIREKLEKHADRAKYETYIWLEWCRLSGWIDGILKHSKKYEILDIKTTNTDPKEWDEEKLLLPTEKQETQGYTYVVGVDDLGLLPEKVGRLRFAFHNNCCNEFTLDSKGNKIDPRHEWVSDIDPVKYQNTIDLLKEGALQLARYEANEPKVCTWRMCKKHGDNQ